MRQDIRLGQLSEPSKRTCSLGDLFVTFCMSSLVLTSLNAPYLSVRIHIRTHTCRGIRTSNFVESEMARMVRHRKMGVLRLLYEQVKVWRAIVLNHVQSAMESTGLKIICSNILTKWRENEKNVAEEYHVS